MFMVPQTVKGIKSIEKDQIRKERAAMMQPKKLLMTTFGAQVDEESNQLDSENQQSARVERLLMNLDIDQ